MSGSNALNFGVPTIASSGPPQVVNPLAAITAGNQAAASLYDLRQKQAQQQIGSILQQATGPDGVVDHQRAQALAAQAGPGVQMGMQSFLTNNSALRGAQTKQAGELHGLVGSMGASLMNDPSDENLAKIRAAAVASGLPPSALAEIDRIGALDPKLRGAEAYKHVVANIDALGQLARGGYATPKLEDFGNVKAPVTTTPPTPWTQGGVSVGRDATTVGPPPGTLRTGSVPYDAQGTIPMDANGVPERTPLGWRPADQPVTNVPGVPSGGLPVGGGGAPGGGGPSQTLPVNPTVQPNTQPGRNAPAPGSPLRPAVVPAAPAAPAVVPPAPSVAPNAPAPFFTGPPQEQPAQLKANVEAYTQDKAMIPNVRTRAENAGHAYDALQVLKLNTGRGAEGISNVRSFLRTVGMLPPGSVKDTDVMDIFNKYTERAMIEAAGGGGTDLARQMATQASPGKTLGTGANLEILRNDMGKTLQTMAAHNSADPAKNGAEYLDHRNKIALSTDPRGFVWNMYTKKEQDQILASVKDDPVADSKLHRAIGMSTDPKLGLSVPVSRLPASQNQAFLPPPTPAPNSFAMAAPQPNALMMGGAGANA